MPVQNRTSAKNARSNIIQPVLTPIARAPLYHPPQFNQMNANLDRGSPMEAAAPSRRGGTRRLGEAEDEEGEESVEEEGYEEIEVEG
ncbi:hypothetical protein O181_070179 [Austropuccinia psidii MF-1]|uniref:Uncharacterized protein n=1 Tax=Austropuccinia psidii MF-1 TaxID=1389203 RepID=A0A9Q3F0R4_9BASI|nr:hypothetical protein [Austropuccinia psidii MF-1]